MLDGQSSYVLYINGYVCRYAPNYVVTRSPWGLGANK